MGMLGNLSYSNVRPKYYGVPVAEMAEAVKVLDEKFYANKKAHDQFEIMASNIQTFDSDRGIVERRIQQARDDMEDVMATGRYEYATNNISKIYKDFAADNNLKLAQEDYTKYLTWYSEMKKKVEEGTYSEEQFKLMNDQALATKGKEIYFDKDKNEYVNRLVIPTAPVYQDIEKKTREIFQTLKEEGKTVITPAGNYIKLEDFKGKSEEQIMNAVRQMLVSDEKVKEYTEWLAKARTFSKFLQKDDKGNIVFNEDGTPSFKNPTAEDFTALGFVIDDNGNICTELKNKEDKNDVTLYPQKDIEGTPFTVNDNPERLRDLYSAAIYSTEQTKDLLYAASFAYKTSTTRLQEEWRKRELFKFNLNKELTRIPEFTSPAPTSVEISKYTNPNAIKTAVDDYNIQINTILSNINKDPNLSKQSAAKLIQLIKSANYDQILKEKFYDDKGNNVSMFAIRYANNIRNLVRERENVKEYRNNIQEQALRNLNLRGTWEENAEKFTESELSLAELRAFSKVVFSKEHKDILNDYDKKLGRKKSIINYKDGINIVKTDKTLSKAFNRAYEEELEKLSKDKPVYKEYLRLLKENESTQYNMGLTTFTGYNETQRKGVINELINIVKDDATKGGIAATKYLKTGETVKDKRLDKINENLDPESLRWGYLPNGELVLAFRLKSGDKSTTANSNDYMYIPAPVGVKEYINNTSGVSTDFELQTKDFINTQLMNVFSTSSHSGIITNPITGKLSSLRIEYTLPSSKVPNPTEVIIYDMSTGEKIPVPNQAEAINTIYSYFIDNTAKSK